MVRMYKCPRCGSPLYKKDRENGTGQFYHCESCGYIASYYDTYNLNTDIYTDYTLNICPRCGGTIIQKIGGPRGIFYGCVNYPMCDFAYSSSNQNVNKSNITPASSLYHSPTTYQKSDGIKESSSHNCPKCGAKIKQKAKFCGKCGQEIKKVYKTNPSTNEKQNKDDDEACGIICCLVIIILYFFSLMNSESMNLLLVVFKGMGL